MNPVIVAVDPGLSGAVVRLAGSALTVHRDFKTHRDIVYAIQDLSTGVAGDATHIILEAVHAMPGQGVCSMFSFGKSTGVAVGAIAAIMPHLPLEEVAPQRWQNFFRQKYSIGREQPFDSRALAIKILPEHADLFKRKKDHNTADACLIAVWKAYQLSSLL